MTNNVGNNPNDKKNSPQQGIMLLFHKEIRYG